MKILAFVSLAALTLTACDSKQEQARKAEIDAHAEKLEDAAKATKKDGELDAEVAKKEAAAKAEALKAEADKVRDQK
jgi:uncharacterized protein YcfL